LLACSIFVSCKDKDGSATDVASSSEQETPTTAIAPPLAEAERQWQGDYLLQGTTLVRLQGEGKSEEVLRYPGATYCETDNRSQAIWLLGDAGLSVYDLESQALELVVAAPPGAIGAFEVRFGLDQGKVGNADGLRDDVALIVIAAKRIELRSEIICEGEREALCYVDSSTDDPDLWELKPAAAATKARYDAMKLADTPLLKQLAERRLARPEEEVETGEDPEDEANEGDQAASQRVVVDGKILCGTIRQPAATAPAATVPSALPQ
jgi:hypothetical protein